MIRQIIDYYYKSIFNDFINELSFIKKYYHVKLTKNNNHSLVVFMLDGKYSTCGFADRLRGIITSYAYAKAKNIEFKILHEFPFRMADYLQPNLIDWEISENEVSHNLLQAHPIVMMNKSRGTRLFYIFSKKQHHIYTNINALNLINKHYKTSFKYSDLYFELFKPSEQLKCEILKYNYYINQGYISVSFRFMQLMGDFKDNYGLILEDQEQQKLIEKCINFVIYLHNIHKETKYVLVTSDSIKFLNIVKKLEFVFIVPGETGHIGFCNDNKIILKTMLDFNLISLAKKVYMGYSGKMYKSHFAKSAAETTNTPFEAIEF